MTMTEKVKTVCDIAAKNGLPLNKKFTDSYLTAHSMFEGPAALAERIVGGMWDMCRHGINNGFDGGVKNALDGLSDIVVALSELGNEQIGKLTKYTVKAEALLKKELSGRKSCVNAALPVAECIESCKRAADVIIELREGGKGFSNIDENQFALLRESRTVLDEASQSLDSVLDTSSRSAQEKAESVIKLMQLWREDCVRLVCTGSSVNYLNDAKLEIEAWGKLSEEVSRRERAKENITFDDSDELSNLIKSKAAIESLDTFMRRMESEKADIELEKARIEERENAAREKRDKLNAELESLEAEKAKVIDDVRNGADLKAGNRKIKDIKQKMDDVYLKIGGLDDGGMPDFVALELADRQEIYNELEKITGILVSNRIDLGFLAETVEYIDFNALIDLLGGRTTESSKTNSISSIHGIYASLNEKLENRRKTLQQMRDNGKVLKRVLNIETPDRQSLIDKARAARTRYDDELDPELLAALESGGSEKQNERIEELDPELRKIIPLGDDDR